MNQIPTVENFQRAGVRDVHVYERARQNLEDSIEDARWRDQRFRVIAMKRLLRKLDARWRKHFAGPLLPVSSLQAPVRHRLVIEERPCVEPRNVIPVIEGRPCVEPRDVRLVFLR